jgi:hypothetical protein
VLLLQNAHLLVRLFFVQQGKKTNRLSNHLFVFKNTGQILDSQTLSQASSILRKLGKMDLVREEISAINKESDG